jgi:hypothetical protein
VPIPFELVFENSSWLKTSKAKTSKFNILFFLPLFTLFTFVFSHCPVSRQSNWEVVEGIPNNMYVTDVHPKMDPVEREHIQGLLESSEIHPQNTSFLQAKVRDVVYGNSMVDQLYSCAGQSKLIALW